MIFSRVLVFVVIFLSLLFFFLCVQRPDANPLDGCVHVYLDMGSNIGVQIRKLYEPSKYKGATILPLFEKYFGSDRSVVCAVGFEPNPAHEDKLKNLEKTYRACGWPVTINTRTGVGKEAKGGKFRVLNAHGMEEHLGMNSRILAPQEVNSTGTSVDISTVRIAKYVNDVVATRKIPNVSTKPNVVIKLDVEGRELELMIDMMMSGALRHVDNIHIDWPLGDKNAPYQTELAKVKDSFKILSDFGTQLGLEHTVEILHFDDETFYDDKTPITLC